DEERERLVRILRTGGQALMKPRHKVVLQLESLGLLTPCPKAGLYNVDYDVLTTAICVPGKGDCPRRQSCHECYTAYPEESVETAGEVPSVGSEPKDWICAMCGVTNPGSQTGCDACLEDE
ncbi:unnamed protein product, partial [marine sediment metagenome]